MFYQHHHLLIDSFNIFFSFFTSSNLLEKVSIDGFIFRYKSSPLSFPCHVHESVIIRNEMKISEIRLDEKLFLSLFIFFILTLYFYQGENNDYIG